MGVNFMQLILLERKKILLILVIGALLIYFGWNSSIFVKSVLMPQKRYVAIVIDDFGGYAAGIKEMMEVPYPLTFAVLPFGEFAYQQAATAARKGYEIIIHMPFEAEKAKRRWYGKKYIAVNTPKEEIRQIVKETFTILPMAKGFSNHMGSKATADLTVMTEVISIVAQQKKYYFDSRTAGQSAAFKVCQKLQLPYLSRDIFLDNLPTEASMRSQLRKLMEQADQKKYAVGIGHVGPTGPALARILKEELPRYEKQGYHFVTLSQLKKL